VSEVIGEMSALSSHGQPRGVDVAYWLGPDPELGLAHADMGAWMDAHPCECEALCACDSDS
jgi:hypothetical protein